MFNQFFGRFSAALRKFMTGRHGNDQLNMALLSVGVVCSLLSMFIRVGGVNMILTVISYGFLGLVIFRSLSRNTYKRYQENRKYRQAIDRIKDREHRYFECPKCRQPVRVPRGKGKIAITCPKCREKFIKKT